MGSASRHPGSGPPNRPNVPARRDFSDRAHACPAVPGVGVDEDVTRCGHSDAVMQRCAAARLRALRDARPGHPRRMGHSAVAHDRDLGRGAVELCEIVAGELNGAGAKVLFQAVQLRRPGDRYYPRPLGEEPGQCELSGCGTFRRTYGPEQVDERPVRLLRRSQ